MDAPEPVTKQRRWTAFVRFDVDDTPDPDYDVAACERMGDTLYKALGHALEDMPGIVRGSAYVEDVTAER